MKDLYSRNMGSQGAPVDFNFFIKFHFKEMHLMQQRLGKLLMQDEQQKKVIDLNEESDALSTRTNNILHN